MEETQKKRSGFSTGLLSHLQIVLKTRGKNQDNNKKELLFMEPFNEKEPEDQLIQRLIKSLKKLALT